MEQIIDYIGGGVLESLPVNTPDQNGATIRVKVFRFVLVPLLIKQGLTTKFAAVSGSMSKF